MSSARVYSLTELAGMLRRAGLRILHAYGNYDMSPYTFASRRLIILSEYSKAGEPVEEAVALEV
ncbi:MAG: hypothetical protein HYU29_03455 [Chloroflexi bacterium]|nr:hypothetical protein [Chloroflexota bacterium]